MAIAHKSYKTKVQLDLGPWVGNENMATQEAGYVKGLPSRLYASDSFTWATYLFANSEDSTGVDHTGCTCVLWISLDIDGASRTQIGTGAISGAANHIITYTVEADEIPEECWGQDCIITATASVTTYETTVMQRIAVEYYTKGSGSGSASGGKQYGYFGVPASEMTSRTTNGAEKHTVEWATNDVNAVVMGFDATTEEAATFIKRMPDDWDLSNLKAVHVWTNDSGLTTETVRFSIAARWYTDDGALDQAFGTAQVVDDTWIAQGDIHIAAATPDIVPAGTPALGGLIIFEVRRVVASDDLTGDADLLSIYFQYGKTGEATAEW